MEGLIAPAQIEVENGRESSERNVYGDFKDMEKAGIGRVNKDPSHVGLRF